MEAGRRKREVVAVSMSEGNIHPEPVDCHPDSVGHRPDELEDKPQQPESIPQLPERIQHLPDGDLQCQDDSQHLPERILQ